MNRRTIKLALATCLWLAACGDEPAPAPAETTHPAATPKPSPRVKARPDAPNLVLIVLDTVRRDHLSSYGYERPTSPLLTGIASRGVRFERASSNATWTHPAHASMLTGVYASAHGARYAGASGDRKRPIRRLDERAPRLLQQILGDAGYHTSASVGAPVLAPGLGVMVDFDAFAGARPDQEPSAKEVNARALRALDARPPGKPVFVLVNYFDAHSPYSARPEGAPWLEPATLVRQVDLARSTDGLPRFARLAAGLEQLSPEHARAAVDNYDSEIVQVDRALGALIDALEERGLLANTVVAITSDHGEYFGEHGLWEHGRTLYRELTDVPLVIFGKGVGSGRTVETPVQTLDLFATFLEAAGIEVPASNRGASLWPLLRGEQDQFAPHPIAAEAFADPGVTHAVPAYGRDYRCFERGELRLIVGAPQRHLELFDLAEDPRETQDISSADAARARELEAALDAWLPPTNAKPGAAPRLTPEERARLERLGYLNASENQP